MGQYMTLAEKGTWKIHLRRRGVIGVQYYCYDVEIRLGPSSIEPSSHRRANLK